MVSWVLDILGISNEELRSAAVPGVLNFLGLVITAIFAMIAWLGSRALERREKVHDFQVALHAEISSELLNLEAFNLDEHFAEIKRRYAADIKYSVAVPHLANNVIFDAIVGQIHVLPAKVIAPVVKYERLRESLDSFASDMRASSFGNLSQDRQLEMYEGYIFMRKRLRELAQNAVVALKGRRK